MTRAVGKVGEEMATKGPLAGAHFRTGLVAEQDVTGARVRIRFPDRDNLVSWWLPVLVRKSQNDSFYSLPDLNEQVVAYMDEHDEDGCVLGAIYSAVDTPPAGMTADKDHVTYKDNAVIEYDRALHVLKHLAQDGAEIHYDAAAHELLATLPAGRVKVVAPSVQIESPDVQIGQPGGELPVMLNTIIAKFNTHTHGGVETGGGVTGAPLPPSLFLPTDATQHVVES